MTRSIKRIIGGTLTLALAACIAVAPAAAATVLTFEGLGNLAPVGNYYNGGPGGNLGISMSENSLALIDADAGGSGNFGGEPSPSTAMFFLAGQAALMNVLNGFDTGFSFFYTALNSPGSLEVFDGLDGTGNVLASLDLPVTPLNGAPDPTGSFSPFVAIGVGFDGIARSIAFAGVENQIAFDDVTFGSVTPGDLQRVPLPGSLILLAAGGVAAAAVRRRRGQQE